MVPADHTMPAIILSTAGEILNVYTVWNMTAKKLTWVADICAAKSQIQLFSAKNKITMI